MHIILDNNLIRKKKKQ